MGGPGFRIAWIATVWSLSATGATAQDRLAGADGSPGADSTEIRGHVRTEQARFERFRRTNLDRTWGGWGGPCDEIVGRMCVHYDEGDWNPTPEPVRITAARDRLLGELADATAGVPGDAWIRGQRIRYLAEADRWDEAVLVASACRGGDPGWCDALRGYALHGAGLFPESERAFRRALEQMGPDDAASWRDPSLLLDDRGDALRSGDAALPPDRMAERLWQLADPLYLAPGNDRLTEHWSRHVVARLRAGTRNAYGMSWGSDLEELLIRYGWEVGWERTHPAPGEARDQGIVGHHHPDARTYVPTPRAIRQPATARVEDWDLHPDRPRTSYTPLYAPRITTADAQAARFWRGDSVLVVAAYRMTPPEPDRHRPHGPGHVTGPLPVDLSVRSGLFLVPIAGGPMSAVERPAGLTGSFSLLVPAGDYVLSVEAVSDSLAFASRARLGLGAKPVPPDVPALSDALLVDTGPGVPNTLPDAVSRAWPGTSFGAGQAIGVAWELTGLGVGAAPVEYTLVVERRGRSFLETAGSWIGLFGGGPDLELSWREEGVEVGEGHFRATDLDLPDLKPGRYRLTLRATLPGREEMVTERLFTITSHASRVDEG